jgi:hypothetical protein
MNILNKNNNKNSFVLCELHYTPIHGKTPDSYKYIEGHYIVICKAEPYSGKLLLDENMQDEEEDEDDDDDDVTIHEIIDKYKELYEELVEEDILEHNEHQVIRNYTNIIVNDNYLTPQIAQCILLPTKEMICIIKTFWINIIVRAWKRVIKERHKIIQLRCSPRATNYREHFGVWPQYCRNVPGVRGLLCNYNSK